MNAKRTLHSLLLAAALLSAAFSQAGQKNLQVDAQLCERIIQEGGFTSSRKLDHYHKLLGLRFSNALRALGRNKLWVDMGAGQGNAAIQYLREGGQAFVKAIAFKRPFEKHGPDPEGMTFLEGAYLEDIPDHVIGRVDLITDVFGVLSYTPRLGEALAKYFRLLNPGGAIYVHHMMPRITILDSLGRDLFLPEWLKTLPGVRVEPIGDPDLGLNSFRLSRIGTGPVKIPGLKLIHSEEAWPPEMVFQVEP